MIVCEWFHKSISLFESLIMSLIEIKGLSSSWTDLDRVIRISFSPSEVISFSWKSASSSEERRSRYCWLVFRSLESCTYWLWLVFRSLESCTYWLSMRLIVRSLGASMSFLKPVRKLLTFSVGLKYSLKYYYIISSYSSESSSSEPINGYLFWIVSEKRIVMSLISSGSKIFFWSKLSMLFVSGLNSKRSSNGDRLAPLFKSDTCVTLSDEWLKLTVADLGSRVMSVYCFMNFTSSLWLCVSKNELRNLEMRSCLTISNRSTSL